MYRLFLGVLCIGLLLQGCISNKKIIYFQNKEVKLKVDTASYTAQYERTKYKLQVNDNLVVDIRSNNQQTTPYYNLSTAGSADETSLFYNSYKVDEQGNIEIPNIGKVHVAGLTVEEVREQVHKVASVYIRDAFVSVKLSGINFILLGEANSSGRHVAYRNQLTIFEAIAYGGDLRETANRRAIKLVRQYPDGVKTYLLDLTDRNILHSPYYFVQPNDILYIQPLRRRIIGLGNNFQANFQIFLSLVSLSLFIYTFTKR
jgi:polysaccharide export outer membrane protein